MRVIALGYQRAGVQITGVDLTQSQGAMSSLFGRGSSDVWTAGEGVAHFDGQSWSLVTDAPSPAQNDSDPNNTFVTGDAGATWLATPGPRFFRKVTSP